MIIFSRETFLLISLKMDFVKKNVVNALSFQPKCTWWKLMEKVCCVKVELHRCRVLSFGISPNFKWSILFLAVFLDETALNKL